VVALWLAWTMAWGGPCGDVDELTEAAHGGWMVASQRQCLHRKAARGRHERRRWASRLLLADAESRADPWTWTTLAERHVAQVPEDVDVRLALVEERWRKGDFAEVVRLCSQALNAAGSSFLPPEDPRVVQLHRYRTYAALRSRSRVDAELEGFARAWMAALPDDAPAVAWADGFNLAPPGPPNE